MSGVYSIETSVEVTLIILFVETGNEYRNKSLCRRSVL